MGFARTKFAEISELSGRATTGRPYTDKATSHGNKRILGRFIYHLHALISPRFCALTHPDFVGATSGRPLLRICKNADLRYARSPASVAAVPLGGGSDGHRRRISSARSILYHCRRCPHVRAKPRTPRRGARSLHKPECCEVLRKKRGQACHTRMMRHLNGTETEN